MTLPVPVIVGIVFAIAVVIVVVVMSGDSTPAPPSTGPTGPILDVPNACADTGLACTAETTCCSGSACRNGFCQTTSASPPITAFVLAFGDANRNIVGPSPFTNDLIVTGEAARPFTQAGTLQWFEWSGGMLMRKGKALSSDNVTYVLDAATLYVDGEDGVFEGAKVGLAPVARTCTLTQSMSILSANGSFHVAVSSGMLVWSATLAPAFFHAILPSECRAPGAVCSTNTDCCPPYGSCADGRCSQCFGDPNAIKQQQCPSSSYTMKCVNGTWTCTSQCSGTPPVCPDTSQEAVCSYSSETQTYAYRCASRCRGIPTQCSLGTVSQCTFLDGKWEYRCGYNPCADDAVKPAVPKTQFYDEKITITDLSAGYPGAQEFWYRASTTAADGTVRRYPLIKYFWNCTASKWETQFVLDTRALTCPAGKTATVVDAVQHIVGCQSIPPPGQPQTGLCAWLPQPDCPTGYLECKDYRACDGTLPIAPLNNWQWHCRSVETALNGCYAIVSNELTTITALDVETGLDVTIVAKGRVPVYPTILNEYCRSDAAVHPLGAATIAAIDNPAGTLVYETTSGVERAKFYSNAYIARVYTDSSVSSNYVATKWKQGSYNPWFCLTQNPCKQGNTATFLPATGTTGTTGTTYGDFTPPTEPSVQNAPAVSELMPYTTCSCAPGTAGAFCDYSATGFCGGTGATIHTCATNEPACNSGEYRCTCPAGKAGYRCEYSRASCTNHGVPVAVDASGALSECACDTGFAGSLCNFDTNQVSDVCNNHGFPTLDGTACASCVAGFGTPATRCKYDERAVCNDRGTLSSASTDQFAACTCRALWSTTAGAPNISVLNQDGSVTIRAPTCMTMRHAKADDQSTYPAVHYGPMLEPSSEYYPILYARYALRDSDDTPVYLNSGDYVDNPWVLDGATAPSLTGGIAYMSRLNTLVAAKNTNDLLKPVADRMLLYGTRVRSALARTASNDTKWRVIEMYNPMYNGQKYTHRPDDKDKTRVGITAMWDMYNPGNKSTGNCATMRVGFRPEDGTTTRGLENAEWLFASQWSYVQDYGDVVGGGTEKNSGIVLVCKQDNANANHYKGLSQQQRRRFVVPRIDSNNRVYLGFTQSENHVWGAWNAVYVKYNAKTFYDKNLVISSYN